MRPVNLPTELLALEIADHSAACKLFKRSQAAAPPAIDASNPPALARTATIVRDRRHVANRCDGEARGLQRTKRRLTTRTGTSNFNLERAHPMFLRLLRDVFGRDLCGIRGRLARALEPHRSGRRPGDGVALRVGNGDGGVVKRRIHVRHARCNVLALTAAYAGGFLAHSRTNLHDLNAAVVPAATPAIMIRLAGP